MGIANQEITENYAVYNGDCMEVLPQIKKESVGFSVYSPPFPELYQYSNDPRDMSNCKTYEEGLDQYKFIVSEIHRVTKPGRLTAVHCMDLKKGTLYQKDFPGDIIKAHEDAGFNFFCRITIWKDPWLIARRTRMKSLMHKTIVNDSSKARVAGADYIVVFRKSGDSEEPITHKHGFKKYYGADPVSEILENEFRNYTGDQKKNFLSHQIWRRYASPVWGDIRSGRLLPYKEARESSEEKHVCPLQLDVIDRCLVLWSNQNDIVLTPFMGAGSEAYEALSLGRKAIGIELKTTYYNQALNNIRAVKYGDEESNQFVFEFDDNEECLDCMEDEQE